MNPDLRGSAAHVFVPDIDAPVLADDDAHHLSRVLRLRDGESVTASDGVGSWRRTLWSGGGLISDGAIHHDRRIATLTVAVALPKGDRVEWMVEKLTELGVDTIVLLYCTRSAVRWEGDRCVSSLARLARIARSAAAQSRRVWLPTLAGPQSASAFLAENDGAVLCEPTGPGMSALEPLPSCVVVGPEGGFSPEELGIGHRRVALGPTVLRVETAAIAAAAQWVTLCSVDHGA